jgi:hypothetical protein
VYTFDNLVYGGMLKLGWKFISPVHTINYKWSKNIYEQKFYAREKLTVTYINKYHVL